VLAHPAGVVTAAEAAGASVGGMSLVVALVAGALLPRLVRIARRSPAHRRFARIWAAQVAITAAHGIIRVAGGPPWTTYAAGGLVLALGALAVAPARGEAWRTLRGKRPR